MTVRYSAVHVSFGKVIGIIEHALILQIFHYADTFFVIVQCIVALVDFVINRSTVHIGFGKGIGIIQLTLILQVFPQANTHLVIE